MNDELGVSGNKLPINSRKKRIDLVVLVAAPLLAGLVPDVQLIAQDLLVGAEQVTIELLYRTAGPGNPAELHVLHYVAAHVYLLDVEEGADVQERHPGLGLEHPVDLGDCRPQADRIERVLGVGKNHLNRPRPFVDLHDQTPVLEGDDLLEASLDFLCRAP